MYVLPDRPARFRREGVTPSPQRLLWRVFPTKVFPEEQPAEAQALDVHLLETLVVVRRLAARLEVDGPLRDPVDITRGRQDVLTEQMVREHDPMEDVLFRQPSHIGHTADLDSVTRDDGAVRAYCSPGHDSFR